MRQQARREKQTPILGSEKKDSNTSLEENYSQGTQMATIPLKEKEPEEPSSDSVLVKLSEEIGKLAQCYQEISQKTDAKLNEISAKVNKGKPQKQGQK
uniref:Uncharacterized protein n=1 Tax=Romanomermis culicivorax TaxID=13658 RepID=A0A915IXG2_ROMCU